MVYGNWVSRKIEDVDGNTKDQIRAKQEALIQQLLLGDAAPQAFADPADFLS